MWGANPHLHILPEERKIKIGLIDVDSHNFPNLALMKLSAFHKRNGDDVSWYSETESYDIVYASKIFTYSNLPVVENTKEYIVGGAGVDLENRLDYEVEHIMPDYSLYPECDFAVGFLTRGCPRINHAKSRGGFCITPDKDGCVPHKTADLSEFWAGQKKIVLLDQNLLACPERIELIKQLADSGASVEFKGGMDVRYMSPDVIDALRDVRVTNFHFAWDDPRENLLPHFERVVKSGIQKPDRITAYVLTNFWSTIEEDLYRIYMLRKLGIMPYVMVYNKQNFVDDNGHWLPGVEEKYSREELVHFKTCQHMQRWANFRRLITSTPDFEEYSRYKNWANKGFPIRGMK